MTKRRKLAAGNWKMNGLTANLSEIEALCAAHGNAGCDVLICPPATLLAPMAARVQGAVAVGGQDCHAAETGAHTGAINGTPSFVFEDQMVRGYVPLDAMQQIVAEARAES